MPPWKMNSMRTPMPTQWPQGTPRVKPPTSILLSPAPYGTPPPQTKQVLAGIEHACKTLDPAFPFRYTFADAAYQTLYTSELTVSNLSDSFALLAICISCLWLLGLTMFTAEQRRKELGIRKIIGASTGNIVTLLSKDILRLVGIFARGFDCRIDRPCDNRVSNHKDRPGKPRK